MQNLQTKHTQKDGYLTSVDLFSVSYFLWQRAFSPEGLSEMWNEMVKDEEITFNGEETAHPGIALIHSQCF